MKRKAKIPQAPKPDSDKAAAFKGVMDEAGAREARIQSKTVRDLADMLRQIVKSRGKGENRFFAYTDHPLRPAALDAFHLACRLDPCFKSTFTDGANERGERYAGCAVGRIAPPDPATGLKSNTLNRAAVALMNFLERLKRSEADAGENAELLAIADALDGGKMEAPSATKEQSWDDNAPGYIPNSEAVKLGDDDLDIKQLGKWLKPNGSIRYMRKGQRTKVHVQDFRQHLRVQKGGTKTGEALDDAATKYVDGVERRKEEEARRKRANR